MRKGNAQFRSFMVGFTAILTALMPWTSSNAIGAEQQAASLRSYPPQSVSSEINEDDVNSNDEPGRVPVEETRRNYLTATAPSPPVVRAATANTSSSGRSSSAGTSASSAETAQMQSSLSNKLWLNYFNIFYGPSVSEPSSFQPTPNGQRDDNRPLLLENFLTLGYDLTDKWTASGTAYFIYVPVQGQEIILRDPYLKLSNNSIFSTETLNLYGDVRLHMPITYDSRQQDMLAGFQLLIHPTYIPSGSRLTFGVWTWARYNLLGGQGRGDDFESYVGPHVNYQLSPKLALTVLLETGSTHNFGSEAFQFTRNQADVEPGISWDITPSLNFSPYLNLFLGDAFSMKNTSLGATVSWMVL